MSTPVLDPAVPLDPAALGDAPVVPTPAARVRQLGYSTPASAPLADRCVACGQLVTSAPPDGYWLLEGEPWHLPCVRWRERPFPYTWCLEHARRLRTRAWRERRPLPREVVAAAVWFEKAAAHWPRAPLTILRRAFEHMLTIEGEAEDQRRRDAEEYRLTRNLPT